MVFKTFYFFLKKNNAEITAITIKTAVNGMAKLIPSLPNTARASAGIGFGFEMKEIKAIEIEKTIAKKLMVSCFIFFATCFL